MMFRRITTFLRKRKAEQELDDELRASLDALAGEHIRKGVSPQDAMRLARIELGGTEQVKEEVRSVRGLPMLDSLIRDFRHALRNLLRSPGFALSVVVTLGVALGANAAVLGLLDKLILRPLPVKEPSRLAAVHAPPVPQKVIARPAGKNGGGKFSIFRGLRKNPATRFAMSYRLYTELRNRVRAFAGVLALAPVKATMVAQGTPVAAAGVVVTGNYFELLGVKPAIGRVLTPDDDGPADGSPVVVLTHGFWQRQFGSDPSILNRTIRLNKFPMTVVGVAAQGFTGTAAGESVDFFAPVCMAGSFMRLTDEHPPKGVRIEPLRFDSPDLHVYDLIARLAPGTDPAQAERAGDIVYQQLLTEAGYFDPGAVFDKFYNPPAGGYHLRLSPAGYASSSQSALSRDLRTPLLLLMAMVGMLLVIATGNVANLFLARGEARSREIAIRFALGASRWRVLRALLVESLLLTLTAGGLGLLLSRWASALVPVILHIEKLPDGVSTAPDSRIGVAVMGLSLAVGLFIWSASLPRAMGRAALITAQGSGVARHTLSWRRALVVAQTALSIVLLCGSALLSRSLIRLMSVDPGFSVEDRYSFWLDPGRAGYEPARSNAFLTQVLERLEEMPGVKGVSMATALPLSEEGAGSFVSSDQDADANVGTGIIRQSPGHFANLGIAMMSGREFTPDDVSGEKVAVINETLAQKLFGKRDPIGRRVSDGGGPPEWRVVGVVRDVKPGARVPSTPALYLPYRFQDRESARAGFLVRTETDVRLSSEMVRAMIQRIEPGMATEKFESLAGQSAQSLYPDRMMAWVSLGFAGLAVFLCAIGIFGLTSYAVTKRTQEIGVRIVLGATRASIQWLVMREVSLMAAAGCVLGLTAFLVVGRVLSTVIFELTPGDPSSLAIGAAILGVTAFLAGFLPAYRATIVDPASTLRQE